MKKNKIVISSNSAFGSSLVSSVPQSWTDSNNRVPDWIKFSKILCKYDGYCTRAGCWYMHTASKKQEDSSISLDADGSMQDFSVFMKNLPLCTTFDERLDLSNYLRGMAKSFGHVTKCLVHVPRDSARSSTGNIHFKSSDSATDFINFIHLKYINGHTFHALWNGAFKYCSSENVGAVSGPDGSSGNTKKNSSTPVTIRSTRLKKVIQDGFQDGFCLAGKKGKMIVIDACESDSDGPELQENIDGID